MASGFEGDNVLVTMSRMMRLCCPDPATTLIAPPLPSHGSLLEDPHQVTNPLGGLHQGGRYTILPTISVVAPWDDPVHHNLVKDNALSDSNAVTYVVTPTPVLPPPTPAARPSWVGDAALNATHRFYNVLRAVMHGGELEARPALRGEDKRGVEEFSTGVTPRSSIQTAINSGLDPAISPLIQVCAALAVVVVVMVLLFHWHHVRQECLRERRALRRLARRYGMARDLYQEDDDLEKNDSSHVTDVTL
ncbi:uncharacterized protein LOC135102430 [Scylla paramamosain]|uniref:uncharacterized protein LOC135102430 n=1 Tax=Scylla paramamosain TaxID=85552 RepID=UPI0030831CA0